MVVASVSTRCKCDVADVRAGGTAAVDKIAQPDRGSDGAAHY
jgi:hypothetical protein